MKTFIVMQGLPGSGKSHYVKNNFPNSVVCSADHFFESSGKYVFDKTKLGEAHALCFRKAVEAAVAETQCIVIDNTNTTETEVAPYMALSNAFGYENRLIRIDAQVDLCADRNVHGVPFRTIMDLSDRIRKFRPLKWWNFHLVRNYG